MMEWHGAQRWFWASVQEAHGLRDWANRVGGHATLFRASAAHGELDKKVGVYSSQSAVLTQINERLQAQFDPHGVFRTQRLG
jgi:glycolate oxidase FAD binding subunit